jgi:hypothetical protein
VKAEFAHDTVILALLGRQGSGKTTAAKWLQATYGADILSFAGPLKLMAAELMLMLDRGLFAVTSGAVGAHDDPEYFGSADAFAKQMADWTFKETPHAALHGFAPRKLLQTLATECCRRHLGHDVWVNALVAKAVEMSKERPRFIVVDDMRFENEAKCIHGLRGGRIIKLVCTDWDPAANETHQSEAEVDKIHPAFIDGLVQSHRTPGSQDLIAKLSTAIAKIAEGDQYFRNVLAASRAA